MTQPLLRPSISIGLILYLMGYLVLAQKPAFNIQYEHLGLEEGLSQSSVKCLLKDKHGFIWIGTQDGLNRYDGYEFIIFRNDPDDLHSISDNNIRSLYEDPSGRFWVGGENGSLQYLDRQTGRFILFPESKEISQKIHHKRVKRVFEDHEGVLWMVGDRLFAGLDRRTGTVLDYSSKSEFWNSSFVLEDSAHCLWVFNQDGLQRLGPGRKSWTSFPQLQEDKNDKRAVLAFEDRQRQIWFATGPNKLYWIQAGGEQLNHFPIYPEDNTWLWDDMIWAMAEDHRGRLWAASMNSGVCLLDRAAQKFTCYKNQPNDPNSLLRNTVWSFLTDDADNFWVGTWAGGLSRMKFPKKRFDHIRPDPTNKNSLSQEQVESFYEDPTGTLWISTNAGGLNRFDQQKDLWTHFRQEDNNSNGIDYDQLSTIYADSKGTIWLSAYNDGIRKLDKTEEQFTAFRHDPQDVNSLSHNICRAILEDQKGRIWIGAFDGILHQFVPETENFIRKRIGRDTLFRDICIIREDRLGQLWIGSRSDGLVCYDPDMETFRSFRQDPSSRKSLSSNSILFLYWDQKDRLWIGTSGGGLNLMTDEEKGEFKNYRMKDGLPNDVVYAILEDNAGKLWMSTNKGITCFDPETEVFRNFTLSDGLQSYEFNQQSAYKSPYTGKMYFGGINGYNVFHPDSILWDTTHASVVFTSVTRYDPNGATEEPITDYFAADKPSLTLTADEKILGFRFASLGFRQNDKIQYQYQLDGFSDRWQALGTRREVTFTNLNPGQYVLRVKSANSDGLWSDDSTTLAFTILPPWYQTGWAYLLFTSILGAALYFINRFYRTRRRLRQELTERRQTAERLEEMATFKNTFFTNITHEFRTPISVMLGMIRQIKGHNKEKELIERNGQQLLGLINQVLDLNKMEAGKMKVRWQQGDIMHFIRFVAESFSLVTKEKKQKLEVSCTPRQLLMDYDPGKLQKILNNLFSNATKFTPEGGNIRVEAYEEVNEEQHRLQLKISNSGPGIPRRYQQLIFQPYAQMPDSEGGTGLGLPLVRELTLLLGGDIRLDSQNGEGSTFRLSFPIHREATLVSDHYPTQATIRKDLVSQAETRPVEWISGRPTILSVEDNLDVQFYLKTILQSSYNVFFANNGKEALDMVKTTHPDLILSDLMMPEMDGYSLCRILKKDSATQPIPVILLTAKAGQEDKLKGLEYQADAYLIKPFDERELHLQIQQLLQKNIILENQNSNHFAQNGKILKTENGAVLFMEKFHKILDDNLQSENFKIRTLCVEMGMNHVSINKKIKEYTSYTTAQYIRYYRLNLAKKLLRTTDLSVAEISYQVGVPEPSNFNNMFKKAFDKTPKQWRDEWIFIDS